MKLAYSAVDPPGDSQQNLPPVIMLHGMLDSRKTWSSLMPRIAAKTGRKVYSLDLRNHGESGWSNQFNFDLLAEDVDEFMTDHGISKAILIGHSMGGKTALTLALRKPEKVEKLIVEDMTPRNFSPNAGVAVVQLLHLIQHALDSVPKGSDDQTARKSVIDFMRGCMPPEQFSRDGQRDYELDNLPIKQLDGGQGYAWQANLKVLEEALTHKTMLKQELSGQYMGDALFIYGTKSFFKIANEALIPKLFPRAQVIGVQGAGHMIHHEFPEEFLSEVLRFILGSTPKVQSKY